MSNKLNVVDGVAFCASILTPNKSTETYNIDLSVDSDTAEHLKSLGMKAASKKDGSNKVTCKLYWPVEMSLENIDDGP